MLQRHTKDCAKVQKRHLETAAQAHVREGHRSSCEGAGLGSAAGSPLLGASCTSLHTEPGSLPWQEAIHTAQTTWKAVAQLSWQMVVAREYLASRPRGASLSQGSSESPGAARQVLAGKDHPITVPPGGNPGVGGEEGSN